ncbi:hypothetical protein BCD64_10785 [Nostoc sp. MBR 210]|nr:hypothetical protein BCD64_10785 [Nostoc sp. MBR 210]
MFDPQSNSLVGIADLITQDEVIEVKNIQNWKHAVGQIFAYWYYLSLNSNLENKNLIPRVHLFGGNGIDDDRVKLCQALMEKIFEPYTDSILVTYAEESDWEEDEV